MQDLQPLLQHINYHKLEEDLPPQGSRAEL
jgi:hypothetical protein